MHVLELSNFFIRFEISMLLKGRTKVAEFARKQHEYYWNLFIKGGEKVRDIEHPDITQVNRTGSLNVIAQPEHAGTDYFGTEILMGDEIVTDNNTNEVVLKDDLEKYLTEVYGFKFSTAE